MSKVNTFEDAIKLLKTLKGYAEDVDDYEDDFFDDYRQIARVSSRELIDLLLKLEINDELTQSAESASVGKSNVVSYTAQAEEFIKENPLVAREIHTLLDKQHHREDIVSKLEERGLRNLSDEDIDKLVDSFENALSKNDGYYESFWMSADFAIDEFVQEKGAVKKVAVPPTLDELKREYEHFIDITKGICTVEQAKEFQEKYHIPVEINGVSIDEFEENSLDQDIECIRYEFCDHLWYLYDYFDGKPMFDVYYGEYGDNCLVTDINIDSLTPENYSQWLLNEIFTLARDELNRSGNIGYTMPGGKHHIYISVEENNNSFIRVGDGGKEEHVSEPSDYYYFIEPNRVVDGAMEPMEHNTSARYNNFEELLEGCKWCFEYFEDDKEVSLEDKLANASERSEASVGVDGKDTPDIEMC